MTNNMKSLLLLTFVFLPAAALSRSLLGGKTETKVSPTYEPVVFAVRTINAQLAKNNSITEPLSLKEVVLAKSQVVAGEKLYLKLRLSKGYNCDVEVWYRPWLKDGNSLKVTGGPNCFTSQQAPSHVTRLGGISQPLPLSNGEVLDALRYAACAASQRMNSVSAHVLGDISSGVTYTQQVVQGMTYRFHNVPLLPTECRNNGCAQPDTCAVSYAFSQAKRCDLEVWSEPWKTDQYTLTGMSCETDSGSY